MTDRAASIVVFLFFIFVTALCQAQTAILKSASIVEGDVAVLVVEFQNRIPSLFSLETTPLQQDFEVLQIKPSLRGKKYDDEVVNVMHWEIELFPKRKGFIKVPSLNIKGELTPQLMLEVKEWNEKNNGGEKIYIEVSADRKFAYIGQQVIVTLKMFNNKPFRRGILYDLKLDQVEIYPLGADKRYRQTIAGETFTVLERKLAIFAKYPGLLTLPAIEFRGELETINERRIKRVSPQLDLTLLAPDKEFSGDYWLPASDFEVSQKWFHLDKTLTTGDTISRKITFRARGLAAAALPEALLEYNNQAFEVYADQVQRVDQFRDDGTTGELAQTHAIVFTGSGKINIPPITVRWWDVDQGIEKTILLPGKVLLVQAPVKIATRPQTTAPEQPATNPVHSFTVILGLLLTLSGCYAAARWYLARKKRTTGFNRRKFKQACFSSDAPSARKLLISWAEETGTKQSTTGLYNLLYATESSEFKRQLMALDAALYGENQVSWQGHKLWYSFVENCHADSEKAKERNAHLPELYRV